MHSIKKIANYVNAINILGDSNLIIKGLCGIDSGRDGYISYIHQNEYYKYLSDTKASAIIINNEFSSFPDSNKTFIMVDNAAKAFSKLIYLFYEKPKHIHFISKNALISKKSKLGENCYIGHNVIINDNVNIGSGVYIGHGTCVGENSFIDDGAFLSNNVTVV